MDNRAEECWIEYSEKPSTRSYIIKKIIKLGRTLVDNKDLSQIRAIWDAYGKRIKPPSEMEVNSVNISGVSCEWVFPKECNGEKTIIYFHGGAYVFGSLASARSFALLLARHTGERVLSVGYRLAPENPFPAALEDSLAVFHGLLEKDISPNNIVLVGDSAGGGLALATVLALKEKGETLPGAVVCLSPWTDLAGTGESYKTNKELDPIFGKGSNVIKPEYYSGKESVFNPLISPLYGDFEKFPPLLIHVGTDEIILDDSVRLAEKARRSGVKVSIKIWKNMWHVFTTHGRILPEGRQSLKEISAFIRDIKKNI